MFRQILAVVVFKWPFPVFGKRVGVKIFASGARPNRASACLAPLPNCSSTTIHELYRLRQMFECCLRIDILSDSNNPLDFSLQIVSHLLVPMQARRLTATLSHPLPVRTTNTITVRHDNIKDRARAHHQLQPFFSQTLTKDTSVT